MKRKPSLRSQIRLVQASVREADDRNSINKRALEEYRQQLNSSYARLRELESKLHDSDDDKEKRLAIAAEELNHVRKALRKSEQGKFYLIAVLEMIIKDEMPARVHGESVSTINNSTRG